MATYSVRSAAVCSRSCVESTYHTAPDAATPVAVPKKKPDMLLAPKQSTKFDRCRIGMDDLGLNFGMTLMDGKNPELLCRDHPWMKYNTAVLAMLDA